MNHALIIGGSGMLRGAALDLTNRYRTVSVVGRNLGRLLELKKLNPRINPIKIDYTNSAAFIDSIKKSATEHGQITLAVCWIHDTAPDAPLLLASHLNSYGIKADYYHVLSSTYARPEAGASDIRRAFERLPHIDYRQVILGFIVERRSSRWLSNNEISSGVSRSIGSQDRLITIGTTEPWEMRP